MGYGQEGGGCDAVAEGYEARSYGGWEGGGGRGGNEWGAGVFKHCWGHFFFLFSFLHTNCSALFFFSNFSCFSLGNFFLLPCFLAKFFFVGVLFCLSPGDSGRHRVGGSLGLCVYQSDGKSATEIFSSGLALSSCMRTV